MEMSGPFFYNSYAITTKVFMAKESLYWTMQSQDIK